RNHIIVETRGADGRYVSSKSLLAEEVLGVAVEGTAEPKVLTCLGGLAMLSLEPARNMETGQQSRLIQQAIDLIPSLETAFNGLAERRAQELLNDHRRVREASDAKGIRYSVTPVLPVDKIGVYVLMPVTTV